MILSLKVLLVIHTEIGVGIKINLGFSIKHMKTNCWNPLQKNGQVWFEKKRKEKCFLEFNLVLILDFLNTQYNF